MYINDIIINIRAETVCLFADDTSFIISNKSITTLKYQTNEALDVAEKWFRTNKLKLNTQKIHILTAFTKVNENVPKQSDTFLGIKFTESLKWTTNIQDLKNRLASALYCIKIITKNVTPEVTRNTYLATFHSGATYDILIWGASPEIEQVLIMHKKQ